MAYYKLKYPKALLDRCTHISQHGAVNLVVAYRTLTPHYTVGMRMVIHTDNTASQQALHTGRSKDPILGACCRQMWLEAALRDQLVEIRHKPGVQIPLADALSRYDDPAKKEYADSEIAARGLRELQPAYPHPFFTKI